MDAGPLIPDGTVNLSTVGDLDPLVLGLWGARADRIWFAGGARARNGRLLARLDSGQIRRIPTPPGQSLWWVWGADEDTLYACGETGTMLASTAGVWRTQPTGLAPQTTLWGVWGANRADIWAVGGSISLGADKAILIRSQGDGRWTRIQDPAFPSDANFFKVWGSGPDDVHIVGEGGVAVHWNGERFTRTDAPTEATLFTVRGQPGGPVIAVGGVETGVAFRWSGTAWVEDDLPVGVPALNGVYVRTDGTAVAVGARGLKKQSFRASYARA